MKPIECTRNPTQLGSMSSLSLSLKDIENQGVNNGNNHDNSSTRHSSFSDDGESLEAYLSGISENDYVKGPSYSGTEVLSPSFETVGPELEMHSILKGIGYSQIGRIQIRSVDAVLMLLELFVTSKPVVQKEVLILFLKLINEGHPSNLRMWMESGALQFLLEQAVEIEFAVLPYFFQLASSLGVYNIQNDEAKTLFQLAKDTTKSKEFQMQVLNVICNVLERNSPSDYFHFDGFDSYFLFKFPERFPSSRTGYTVAFWMKVSHFLENEFGLVSWQDQSGNAFELYMKKNLKQSNDISFCLCVRIQHGGSSGLTEDFLFDQYNFSHLENRWHHLVLCHLKQKIELIIDGESVQSGTLNYPPPFSKVITSCLGTRLNSSLLPREPLHVHEEEVEQLKQVSNMKNSCYCGQLGTVRFYEGIWDESSAFKVYSKGSLSSQSPRALGIELREFLSIKPQALEKKEKDAIILTSPIQASIPLSSTPPTELFIPPS